MTLYGPLPAKSFLRLLQRIGEGAPGLEVLQEALDALIQGLGAERGFLFRLRRDGGIRVLLARNQDGEPIARPEERISHHAVRRAIEARSPYSVEDARRDRRHRTEESVRTGRQPVSILALPLSIRGETEAGVYLDHRFHKLHLTAAGIEAAEHWRALLEIGLQARERERLLLRARAAARARPAEAPAEAGPPPPRVPSEVVEFEGMVGSSPDMLDLFDSARQLGRSDLPVVICGETGTGKELLARAIHASSRRAGSPFLGVICGGIPDALLESELFGHARGAFTGAEADRKGLLVQADGGTVLLDEVGDMSPQMQQKLLHVLADGRVRPLGYKSFLKVDVRVISSTQRDPEKLVEEGRLRKDLFYRLRGTVLWVPPLRERREEVLVLAERFLERFARAEGRAPPRLSDRVRRRLARHGWPGNVRELENEMRRLASLGVKAVAEKHLSAFVRGAAVEGQAGGGESVGLRIREAVSEAEIAAIRRALARAGGNKSRAAALLGITRKALYRRMARYRI